MPPGDPADWSIDPPVPGDARLVLVYGGAFDPPHRGHVEPALAARDAVGADWIVYVPASAPPLRDAAPVASGADRMRMLRRALAGRDRASVCDAELARGGVSYTIDTLRLVRDRLPAGARLRLLIGADQARQFHNWRDADEILRLAEPVVMVRGGGPDAGDLARDLASRWPAEEAERWRGRVVPTPIVDASSSAVREALARGDDAALGSMLATPVLEYIRERGLYT
ncbi:MAG: nicotinate (nicotinamide) nucleotide adenylyltransferase [Planctomycetota bacterium]|nr:MAG: nicotinate (nicotinamide) nucleotide adenylyltransferase [Planctomycetota bacterium]